MLLLPELEKENIQLEIKKIPPRTIVLADDKLIEQMFINLIGNSRYALENIEQPKIIIDCVINEKNTIIRIMEKEFLRK